MEMKCKVLTHRRYLEFPLGSMNPLFFTAAAQPLHTLAWKLLSGGVLVLATQLPFDSNGDQRSIG